MNTSGDNFSTDYKNIYFVGAGGIGMAALERYFLSQGCNVAGYDRTSTALTAALEHEGVKIVYDDDPELIPVEMRNPSTTLVVYTPAVGSEHRGLQFFHSAGHQIIKRAAVLGMITRNTRGICFAGTHGKTTTSSMAAHILNCSPAGCNAFLGGILRNYDSNLILSETSPFSVVEADEFDRSFHHLRPYIAVITSTDPDHLDIYGTEDAYLEGFAHFTSLIKPGGRLLVHEGLKLKPRPGKDVKVYTYGNGDTGDFHPANIRRGNGTIIMDIVTPGEVITDIELGVPVEINIDNAVAAIGAVWLADALDVKSMRAAMKSFMGPKRRFEFRLRENKPGGHVIIDDYAHHPDELRASISSVKALYPDRKLTVAFQPHLYSRTRDFAAEFADALSIADQVILLEIYPAREEPIPGVTSKIIFDKVRTQSKTICCKENLIKTIESSNFDILLTAGAGDIDTMLLAIVESTTSNSH